MARPTTRYFVTGPDLEPGDYLFEAQAVAYLGARNGSIVRQEMQRHAEGYFDWVTVETIKAFEIGKGLKGWTTHIALGSPEKAKEADSASEASTIPPKGESPATRQPGPATGQFTRDIRGNTPTVDLFADQGLLL